MSNHSVSLVSSSKRAADKTGGGETDDKRYVVGEMKIAVFCTVTFLASKGTRVIVRVNRFGSRTGPNDWPRYSSSSLSPLRRAEGRTKIRIINGV